jgi:phosphatidylglycerol:prolipoprotein diacylglycerol transferase
MFVHPNFDPVIFNVIGPIAVRWYGLSYLLGFLFGYLLGCKRIINNKPFSKDEFSDLIFYIMLGVILGGRIGYILFYSPQILVHDPIKVFYIWEGGMSFHGGLIGVITSIVIFCKKINVEFLEITDFIVPLGPIAICMGRCANFINGELWGRVTDVPWAMVFPKVDVFPRHPSQIYEMFAEGVLLFIIMNYLRSEKEHRGYITGMFLIFYSIFRMFLELFRQPDVQLGFLYGDFLTMGQMLSFPMLLAGIYFIIKIDNREKITVI